MNKDEEDDAPTYVMEDTKESLTKEEYDALVSGKDPKDEDETTAEGVIKAEIEDSQKKQKDKIAEVGAGSKKRKAAKIISDEPGETKEEGSKKSTQSDAKIIKKPKKKAKAVKLTFGDDEG